MDPAFVAHFSDVIQTLATARPKVLMLDDDFRLMMRRGKACACPLHMAEFNRRAGVSMTREELWAHISTHDKTDPLKRIFEQTQKDPLVAAARAFRQVIDEIDPTIQGANCTTGHLCESVIEINHAFAGKGNPTMVRVPNGCYAPLTTRGFSKGMSQAAICASKLRKGGIEIILAETDTIPFNRYAKSARYLHAHFTSSILEGVSGAKHWLTRLSAFEPKSGVAYRDILAKHQGLYEKLAQLAPEIRWVGAASAFLEQTEVDFNSPKNTRNHNHLWTETFLERIGLPFYFSENPEKAVFLEETIAADMTDEQIRALFSESSVFLDGESADILCRRGYGKALGVSVSEWDLGTVSGETFDGTLFEYCTPQNKRRKLTLTDEKTEVLSHNYLRADGSAKLLAPAVTVLERENGRITVVFCGSPDAEFTYTEGFAFLNETRKKQLISLLRRAHALPIHCVGDDEFCLRAGMLPDGTLLAAIFDLGIDPAESLLLSLEKAPLSVCALMPDGTEAPVSFTALENGTYEIHTRIEPMYPLILLIR